MKYFSEEEMRAAKPTISQSINLCIALFVGLPVICLYAWDIFSPGTSAGNVVEELRGKTPAVFTTANHDGEKDALVNRLIESKPNSWVVTDNKGSWTYDEFRLTIYYTPQKAYEHKETWDFFLTHKDGGLVVIQTIFGCREHRLSDETYNKLKCLFRERLAYLR